MELTYEQIEIINAVPSIDRCMKINAFAGTGKTSTLISIAKAYPDKKFFYLAFNRSIAEESKRKFPVNVKVMTTHALAKRYIANKDQARGDYRILEVADILNIDYSHAIFVHEILSKWLNGHYKTFLELIDDTQGIKENVIRYSALAQEFYELMRDRKIEISHSFYLKEFHLNLPTDFKLDFIMVDEAQDTNDVTLDIIANLPGKKIIVGDTHQQIYAFRGSINAMKKIEADKEFFLTNTFRCRPSIVAEANSILSKYKGETQCLKAAFTDYNSPKTTAYLSRTNAELILLIDMITDFNLTRNPHEIFKSSLAVHYFIKGDWKKIPPEYKFLQKIGNETDFYDYLQSTKDPELERAYNNHLKYGDRLIALLEKAVKCSQTETSNITLSTAHSSKGLEWDKVYMTSDYPDLNLLIANKEQQITLEIINEINLQYVASTRAIYELVHMSPEPVVV